MKDSYGGLRDITILRAVAASWKADVSKALMDEISEKLLDFRDALHSVQEKPSDKLRRQEQPAVAQILGFENADQLIREVSKNARIIAHNSDVVWHRVKSLGKKSTFFQKLKRYFSGSIYFSEKYYQIFFHINYCFLQEATNTPLHQLSKSPSP